MPGTGSHGHVTYETPALGDQVLQFCFCLEAPLLANKFRSVSGHKFSSSRSYIFQKKKYTMIRLRVRFPISFEG